MAQWEGLQWYHADTGERVGDHEADVAGMDYADGRLFTAGPGAWRRTTSATTGSGGALASRRRGGEWHRTPDGYDGPGGPPSAVLAVADDTVPLLERLPGLQGNEARVVLLDGDDGTVIGDVEFDRWVSGPVVGDGIYLHAVTVGEHPAIGRTASSWPTTARTGAGSGRPRAVAGSSRPGRRSWIRGATSTATPSR